MSNNENFENYLKCTSFEKFHPTRNGCILFSLCFLYCFFFLFFHFVFPSFFSLFYFILFYFEAPSKEIDFRWIRNPFGSTSSFGKTFWFMPLNLTFKRVKTKKNEKKRNWPRHKKTKRNKRKKKKSKRKSEIHVYRRIKRNETLPFELDPICGSLKCGLLYFLFLFYCLFFVRHFVWHFVRHARMNKYVCTLCFLYVLCLWIFRTVF